MSTVSFPGIPCIYPISSSPYADQTGHFPLIRKFLEGGARLVQVREKRLPDDLLLQSLRPIVSECHRLGARLILNDRPRIALAAGADGVHLGQTDTSPDEARQLLGKGALIGLSTHNRRQFEEACRRESVDYVSVGPIFPTSGKENPDPVVGLEGLRRLARNSLLPVVAIGGIHLDRALETWAAGAHSLALISDICGSSRPAAQVQRYLKLWEKQDECP